MKVLLDENIDIRFRNAFDNTGHEVFTVRYMGWNGIKNGQLLRLMQQEAFDVLIAVDKNLPYQQNADTLPVSVLILDVRKNVLTQLQLFVPLILERLANDLPKEMATLRIA
ncbi:DUF5615 family PIN-like protein [Spirosoma montaniterrae]|uniref:DUF5615 domain-containing protein n=1 Tax=Spirosoma montaniterrae TaxID=1178516 RepID=A0A1P9WZZ6_9BACT|nr:DUF5615 family PIN-like protein [Spirosoma montaniterrae]AQG80950.1 hypothetical protein AWR27_17445 [Spirosoma montaniterrae]